uniref:[histone H3]-lysine(4) N-trimethyltransferase n=1 Tax=Xiphophorus couchianus TaxID=32473 RepID=A0A3B5LYH2_9TELE
MEQKAGMPPTVERFVCPGKGNGLRATARISRGQLVTSAEPLASCVSGIKYIFFSLLSRQETLLRCSQCKMARYCNAACQKQAWYGHKRECKCLRRLLPRIPTDSVRLAARLRFALFYILADLNLMSEQKKQGLSQLASMLELYVQQEEDSDLTQEVTSALPTSCRDPLSLIAKVGEMNIKPILLSVAQDKKHIEVLSLLNHDCRPNCVMVFEGERLQLRAVQDIRPKDELTISYIETLSLTEERQKQLQEQYHFICHCQRCSSKKEEGFMLSGKEEKWQQLKVALPRLEGLKTESNWPALLESCCNLLSAAGAELPDENLYKLRVTDMALDAAVQLGQWEEALRYGMKTLPAYRFFYPDPHPVHGVQLMRVGKLQHYLEHLEDALDTFKEAFTIMRMTHGDGHPLTSDLRMKMEECRLEMSGRH